MARKALMKLGILLFLCCIGISISATYASGKPTFVLSSPVPLALTQIRNNYGISFNPSPTDASRQRISAEQAVSVVNKMRSKPIAMGATFGYMTINANGKAAVFIPPRTKAGREHSGVVKNYPAWLVSEPNVMINSHGPKEMPPVKGSWYTFVDATNGQLFFTVSVAHR